MFSKESLHLLRQFSFKILENFYKMRRHLGSSSMDALHHHKSLESLHWLNMPCRCPRALPIVVSLGRHVSPGGYLRASMLADSVEPVSLLDRGKHEQKNM